MCDVTIVSEDAVRLVREGGVVNRDEAAPGTLVPHIPISTPFTAEVHERRFLSAVHGEEGGQTRGRLVGTVMVVDVHHADDCAEKVSKGIVSWSNPPLERYCHPGAEADCWHWVVEPTGDDDD